MDVPCKPGSVPVVRLALKREKCAVLRSGKEAAGQSGTVVTNPEALISYLRREYGCEVQEWALCVGLNSRNEILGIVEVASGGLDMSIFDPRVVFSALLLMGATSFIVAHNHPSGSTDPSDADISLTNQMKDGGRVLSMRLVDSIIVSHRGHFSFVSRGML